MCSSPAQTQHYSHDKAVNQYAPPPPYGVTPPPSSGEWISRGAGYLPRETQNIPGLAYQQASYSFDQLRIMTSARQYGINEFQLPTYEEATKSASGAEKY